jgi:hypothetical protein
MIAQIGAPVFGDLADMANEDRRADFRSAAREGCRTLGCLDKIDLVQSYGLDLNQARTCDDKRAAVRSLASTKDPRAAEPLRRARAVRGGLGGLFRGGNDCIRKDIDAALKELES